MAFFKNGMKNMMNVGNIKETLENSKQQQGEAIRILHEDNVAILDNLNDHTKALISIYDAIKVIDTNIRKINKGDTKLLDLPKPLVDMSLESEAE